MTPRSAALLGVAPLAFLAVFFAWPVISIVAASLVGAGGLGSVIDPGVVWFTVWQALVSTVLTLAAGLPVAWVVARYRFPGRRLLSAATLVPFVLPTLVVGVAFLAMIGPDGVLGIDLSGTPGAIIAAHVFFNTAVVVRIVGGLWAHLDRRIEDTARSLGAGPWRVMRMVTLPLLRPAILSAAAIVFLFSFTSFGTVLVLGGPRLATIEVDIYRRAVGFDLKGAAILSLLQMAGVVAALIAYSRHMDRSQRQSMLPADPQPPKGRRQRAAVAAAVAWALAIIGIPLATLAWKALSAGGGLGVGAPGALESASIDVGAAGAASAGYAIAAAAIALGVGVPAALIVASRNGRLSRWFDTLLMLPLGTSAVTLGFGMLVALDWPVDLRGSWVLIPVAHALVAVPFVVRSMAPVLGSVGTRVREAASSLGASPSRAWREIDLPIAARAATVAAGFALVVSLGEFGATTFLARPGTRTIPLAIFQLLGRPGSANFQAALLLSLLLVAVTAVVVLSVDRIRLPGRTLF